MRHLQVFGYFAAKWEENPILLHTTRWCDCIAIQEPFELYG